MIESHRLVLLCRRSGQDRVLKDLAVVAWARLTHAANRRLQTASVLAFSCLLCYCLAWTNLSRPLFFLLFFVFPLVGLLLFCGFFFACRFSDPSQIARNCDRGGCYSYSGVICLLFACLFFCCCSCLFARLVDRPRTKACLESPRMPQCSMPMWVECINLTIRGGSCSIR